MIKIYGGKIGSAFRCHVLMLEMGLEFETVDVDLRKGEQLKPEYLELNPNGKIPCIVDGDFVLWESMAINNYLAEKYQADLAGSNPQEKALIDQWSYWSLLELQNHLYTIAFNRFFLPEDQRDEVAIEKAMEELSKPFGILEGQLDGKDYMLGERFTLADINVGSVVLVADFAQHDYSPYKNISRWITKLKERPSFEQIPMHERKK